MTHPRLGHRTILAVCAISALILFAGTLMSYGRRQVFDTEAFTSRAVAVVHQEPVRQALAATLATQAVESGRPNLVAVRPLVEGTISRLIASGTLDPILSRAISQAHQRLFSGDVAPFVLNLQDILVLARGVLGAASPGAASLPVADTVGQVEVVDGGDTAWVRRADLVRWLGVVLPLLAVALLGTAVLLAKDRRRAVTVAGLATATAGLLVILTGAVARRVAVGHVDADRRDVARAVWDGLLGDLGHWGLVLVVVGTLVAASGASVLPQFDVGGGLRATWRFVLATPGGSAGTVVQVARAVAAIGLGFLAILDTDATVRLILLVAGAIALIWGVFELLRLSARTGGRSRAELSVARRRSVAVAASITGGVATVGLLVLGGLALATGGGDAAVPPPGPAPCNGHAELCDRSLNDVAMMTSHNAMSAAEDPGWFNAHHYNPIVQQLDAGVRGLLIDTHLGQETSEHGFGGAALVQTDLGDTTRAQIEAEIGAESLAAAERLSGRLVFGQRVDTPRLYLCHGLCEIGATDAVDEFARIRAWLDDHPDQVIVIVIQDESPMADTVAALERSGLAARAWPLRLTAEDRLPTLREMIDRGTTALIMHESSGGAGPPWYQDAYAIMQETPYAFASVSALQSDASCVPKRGPDDAPLFLLNHWLDKQPVQVSQAQASNTREVLLDRARLCQKERGRLPNLVAINFVEIGDAAAVVDELNGVATP